VSVEEDVFNSDEEHVDGEEEEEEKRARSFIAPEGAIRMHRNKEGRRQEVSSDDEGEDDDEDETNPKKKKRLRVFEPPHMNSAFEDYLETTARRLLAAERMDEGGGSVSGSSVDRAIDGLQADITDVVPKASVEMDINGKAIIDRMYDRLGFKEVMSKNSSMTQDERNRAIDIAFCEVVVNDVCDTVMKNKYRDQNSAVYWYMKRMANNIHGDDVAVIEKHQWTLFWIEVKEKVMARYNLFFI
jgi:hypothetical protein